MTEPRWVTIKAGYEQFVPPRVPPGILPRLEAIS
jgi:hypothetical protein